MEQVAHLEMPVKLSTRTQARGGSAADHRDMLWSDPENEPPKDMREMQGMLRRLGVLMALAMVLAMLVTGLR
ncbi:MULTISPECIES: hypothetical protein [unclassified Streptomyces]|uniref:morphogenic membrane protein MmpB n=1 Tax=Streptomyces sp. CC219B TaxID=3044574 RepID=UPI001661AEC7|nr:MULTISPECIES: hypothetical protein [unclassified Streptomyces]MBD0839365.1 hypothetical protein [Streptomyces sp. TRM68416]